MSERVDAVAEAVRDRRANRRRLALALLVLLVLLGVGLGTVERDDPGPDPGPDGNLTTPTAVDLTPVRPPATGTTTGTRATTTRASASATAESATPRERRTDDTPTAVTATRTVASTDPGSPGSDHGGAGVDVRVDGGSVLVQAAAVAPGERGRGTVVFRNAGDRPGRFAVRNVTVEDDENGLREPELAVGDDATTGELSAAMRVRVSVTDARGAREYLFGNASRYVPLASIAGASVASGTELGAGERATVTLEWTLPESTGNAVQSDTLTFDVDFGLRATGR